MKKFKFGLQRVLDYRKSLKKDSERELALKNAVLHEREERLEDILFAQDNFKSLEKREMNMAELMLRGDYLCYLQETLVRQRALVKEAMEAVEQARDIYMQRAVEFQSLETLREKKVVEYKCEAVKFEKKELDKLTVQRHRFKHLNVGKE